VNWHTQWLPDNHAKEWLRVGGTLVEIGYSTPKTDEKTTFLTPATSAAKK
jgi:hypothetical protein